MMRKKSYAVLQIALVFVLIGNLASQELGDPAPPKPQPRNLVVPSVQASVSIESTQTFLYSYSLFSGPDSEQPISYFAIATSLSPASVYSPEYWFGSFSLATYDTGGSFPDRVSWIADEEGRIAPSDSRGGYSFRILALPAVTKAYCKGWVTPVHFEVVPRFSSAPQPTPENLRFKAVDSIGPALDLSQPHTLDDIVVHAIQQFDAAQQIGWLENPGTLRSDLSELRLKLASSSSGPEPAVSLMNKISEDLQALRDDGAIASNGFVLIESHIQYIKSEIQPPSSLTTLSAVKDLILSERHELQNDGANPLLTLEKIQGKATRSAVGFDLSQVDVNTLSRATLTFTVDPNSATNGWGNGETVRLRALTTDWVEGTGINFGLKKKDQIAGDGSGATWFAPQPSAAGWSGGLLGSFESSSAPVVITNFFSGTIEFDVTEDLSNTQVTGWILVKDQENKGSKVSFYSREGAAAASNPDLAPKLLLESGQVASSLSEAQSETLLSQVGFGVISWKFGPVSTTRDVSSVKELLQRNKAAALAVEQLLSQVTLTHPVANGTTLLTYRSWVSENSEIANSTVKIGS